MKNRIIGKKKKHNVLKLACIIDITVESPNNGHFGT